MQAHGKIILRFSGKLQQNTNNFFSDIPRAVGHILRFFVFVASEKSTQGCQGITATLVTSGDLVRILSNKDAASSESSSSLVKHRSQKRPAMMLAPSYVAGL